MAKEKTVPTIDPEKELSGDAFSDEEKAFLADAKAEREGKGESTGKGQKGKDDEGKDGKQGLKEGEIKIGDAIFDGPEALGRAYSDLQSVMGRQGSELGELRQTTAELAAEIKLRKETDGKAEKKEVELPDISGLDPMSDPEGYLKGMAAYNTALIQRGLSEGFEQMSTSQQKTQRETKMREDYKEMFKRFRKDHPDATPEQIKELAAFADRRGILQIEDAYSLKNIEERLDKAKKDGRLELVTQLEKAGQLPPSLSSVGGGGEPKLADVDRMSDAQYDVWAEAHPIEAEKALREAPGG